MTRYRINYILGEKVVQPPMGVTSDMIIDWCKPVMPEIDIVEYAAKSLARAINDEMFGDWFYKNATHHGTATDWRHFCPSYPLVEARRYAKPCKRYAMDRVLWKRPKIVENPNDFGLLARWTTVRDGKTQYHTANVDADVLNPIHGFRTLERRRYPEKAVDRRWDELKHGVMVRPYSPLTAKRNVRERHSKAMHGTPCMRRWSVGSGGPWNPRQVATAKEAA